MGIIEFIKNIKLRIIIFGKNKIIESSFCSESKKKNYSFKEKDVEYFYYDIFPSYEFIKMKNESIEKIKDLLILKEISNVVILYFNNEENDDIDIKLIQEISQLDEKYHPFLFFFSSEKKNRNYYQTYIKNSKLKFDYLNIYCIEKNDRFIFELKKLLKRRENYYKGEEMYDNIPNDIAINLCVIGKPGKGKSTFINTISEEKVSLEGSGTNVTFRFNKYQINKKIKNDNNENNDALLNIYDCPGFTTDGEEIKKLKNKIDEKFAFFKKNHDYIHGFLYFTSDPLKRTLDNAELDLLVYLENKLKEYNQDSIILFIINPSNETDKNDKFSYKQKLLQTLRDKFGESQISNPENIIEINLKNHIFGIDNVFQRLYNFFKMHKIQLLEKRNEEEEKVFNERQKNLILKSMFFKYIQNEKSLIERFKIPCEILIEKAAKDLETENIKKDLIIEKREEMLKNILKTLNSSIKFDINKCKLQENEEYKSWLKNIPFLGKFLESKFFLHVSPEITQQIGKDFMQMHIDLMLANSNNAFILKASNRYNNSIELLKELSKNYENLYDIKVNTSIDDTYFLIKFTTNFNQPKLIISNAYLEGEFYIFKVQVNKPIENSNPIVFTLKKKIEEFKLKSYKRNKVQKEDIGNKCNVTIYFELEKIDFTED